MRARNCVADSSLPHASAQAGSRCFVFTTSLSQAVLSVCGGASALSVAIAQVKWVSQTRFYKLFLRSVILTILHSRE